MQLCDQLFLFCLMMQIDREYCSNLWKMIRLFLGIFRQFKEWLKLKLHKIIRAQLCFQLFLFGLVSEVGTEEWSKLWKMIIF